MSVLEAMTAAVTDGSPIAAQCRQFPLRVDWQVQPLRPKDVHNISEGDARLFSQIACMNFANATSSEDRYTRQLILFIWL
jgi:hypothetical protein